MTTTRVLRNRGATVTVAAFGEVLFVEGQDIPRWTARFSRTISRFAAQAAPSHNYAVRPLRPHDRGVPLKKSFTSTTQANAARMRVDAAVGSTAPYSTFVDQGTGIYNPQGGGPYPAKVLPPWREGEGSLYEATWTPGKKQVAPVMIRGQRGQGFMEEGLNRAFTFMMRRAAQVVTEPRVGQAMAFFPENLALRGAGNTPNDAAFRANMEQWRSWRDEAFWRGDQLGKGQTKGRTRKGFQEARDAYRQAQSDLAASRAAAQRRARQQAAALRDEERRKQEGRERRAREARKAREREARTEAVRFARNQRRLGSRVTGGSWVLNADGTYAGFKVTYITMDGDSRTKVFRV